MATSLFNSTPALFKGAADTQEGISDIASKERIASDALRQRSTESAISNVVQQAGANRRQQISEEGANQRQQAEFEQQFITLTPQIKKGAKGVTGDASWDDIPDGYKMRADVYSGLLSAGSVLNHDNQPKTFEAREGDKIFVYEYDPKTRFLRKLNKGGEAFSPDQKDTTHGSGASLNPFTLQNIISRDEQALRTMLGAKGSKGIPTQGLLPGVNAEEANKLATVRALTDRIKNNYANLNKLEVSRGLDPTELSPDVADVITALGQASKPSTLERAVKSGVGQAVLKPFGLGSGEDNKASGTQTHVTNVKTGQSGWVPTSKLKEKLDSGDYKLYGK